MGQGDFGFSSLNNNLNSSINNGFGVSTLSNLDNLIVPVRVKSIVLNSSHPRFIDLGGWSALGAIEYELVTNPTNFSKFSVAYPINPNIKNYPLLEEIVYIMTLPNTGIGENNASQKSYYNNVAVWNHPHHNAYPTKSNTVQQSQNKSYDQTQVGSPSVISNNPVQTNLGKTFKEKGNIHPLLPFEGDVIHEGRWGNSIRLGSTVMSSASLSPNDWSTEGIGKDGDPIIVIRNGQSDILIDPLTKEDITNQGWIPIIENINNDISSIYITSTQNIPLKAASTDYTSYNKNKTPNSPNKYSGPQIILDSGRLVFNSWGDHILLSSAKSINLNSQESVNIDTKKFITQADNIYLGKEDLATEPLLLGDTTVQLLRDLTSTIKELATSLQFLQSLPVVPNQPAIFPSLAIPCSKVLGILDSLNTQLGSTSESCTITSKRNYTV
jgi:hypothetical protein